ncbi:tyrosine-type recombinase/integrase [Mycobacterium interjectum]|uniref:tyrosine-type recombinase/integrase n=1 Tax=Mycobacterium interjectum TaxID=33895 RepID=UPI000B0A0A35|nr:tyrosine-type recombinase/integrase [Mycobacterium interjectum]
MSAAAPRPGARKPPPPEWAPAIAAYLGHITGAGYRDATVKLRSEQLSLIARGLGGAPEQATAEQLMGWLGTRTWSPATRKTHREAALGFFRWAAKTGRVPRDFTADLPPVRLPKAQPRPAPDAVWNAALAAAEPRVGVMLRLAAEAGLRRGEVAAVHSRDLIDGPSLIVHGKGGKARIVPLSAELAAAIRAAGGWVFPSRKGDGHLTAREVGHLVAGVLPSGWSMHTLRHRFATRAYRGSRNLRAVQQLLGHESVLTTERYTAVDDSEIRAAAASAWATP